MPAPFGSDALPGLVFAFRIGADGVAKELSVDAPIPGGAAGFLWLHFNLANAQACLRLKTLPELPPEAAQGLLAKRDYQQIDCGGACVFGVIADLARQLGGSSEQTSFMHFAMTPALLVTARRNPLNGAEMARQALRGGHRVASVAALFELIVEHVAGAIDRLADRLAVHMDQVEERILDGATSDDRQKLGAYRRTTVRMHRQLAGLRTVFREADLNGMADQPPPLQIDAARLTQRLEGIDHEIEALRERARMLQEEISNQLAEESNRHLRALSIVTILFIPPTLIAGLFGMNLKGLPFAESDIGFWSGAFAGLVSSFGVYMLLRWFGIR